MSEILNMGGYGAFIWPAYGITVVVLGGMIIWAVAGWNRAKARLAALEPARHSRAQETKS
jgi:heme exporter protein D